MTWAAISHILCKSVQHVVACTVLFARRSLGDSSEFCCRGKSQLHILHLYMFS